MLLRPPETLGTFPQRGHGTTEAGHPESSRATARSWKDPSLALLQAAVLEAAVWLPHRPDAWQRSTRASPGWDIAESPALQVCLGTGELQPTGEVQPARVLKHILGPSPQTPGCLALFLSPLQCHAQEDSGVPAAGPHRHHPSLITLQKRGRWGQTAATGIGFQFCRFLLSS